MWSPEASRLLLAAALALMTAACGFQPLYADRSGDAARAGGPPAVSVGRIAEREGQTLRMALQRAFASGAVPDYTLDVALDEKIATIAIDGQGDAIRRGMTLTAQWRLTPIGVETGLKPIAETVRIFESFNVLASDFANLSAERTARERAAERLAQRIVQSATARLDRRRG